MIIPANIIASNKLADVKVSFEVRDELMQWADLIVWQRQYKPNLLEFAKKYKTLGKKQVFEIDDDLWSLTPANPAYVHYPHAVLKQLNEFINTCDAVTCSTEPLKQVLVQKFKKPTYVLPNSILSNYIIPPNEIKDEIRIGWIGSAHHHDDLKYAIHAIKEVHNKYKNTKLVFMGGTIDRYLDMFDRSRTEYHQWVDFKNYYDKLNSLNLHIGLAPIEDNKFNVSKCLVGSTMVCTDKGVSTIDKLSNCDSLVWQETAFKKISNFFEYKKQKTKKFITKNGYEIEGTPHHKLRVNENFVEMQNIKVGDKVDIGFYDFPNVPYQEVGAPLFLTMNLDAIDFSKINEQHVPRVRINERWGMFLGAVIGDGCVSSKNVTHISCDVKYQDFIDNLVSFGQEIGLRSYCYVDKDRDKRAAARKRTACFHSRNFRWFLAEKLGFYKQSKVLEVPEIILKSPKSVIAAFISGLFETDGYVSSDSSTIAFTTKNKKLAQQVQFLLLGFKIKSKLYSHTVKEAFDRYYGKTYYTLGLRREACDIFYKEIGFVSKIKQDKLKYITEKKHSNRFFKWELNEEIVSIEDSENDVYDIEVPDGHYYLANGIISHNSNLRWEEMAMCGAAIIASDVYPYAKTIENGKDGIIVKKNRHLEWVKALTNLVENPEKISELCNAAQTKVREKFDYYKNIGMWVNVYNEVLGEYNRIVINSEVSTEYAKPKSAYELWFEKNEPTSAEIAKQITTKFEYEPKISIATPVYNPDKKYFINMVNSVLDQTYSNWELCLADASTDIEIKKLIESYAVKDSRIKAHFLSDNKGISENSNRAISVVTGDYVCLLDHDDTLAPFALHEIVKTINENKDVEFIYSDEDKLDELGNRTQPHFKPNFSPELMLGYNYICHLSVFKKSLLDQIGNFNSEFDGAQDYDLILRATENTKNIIHIPKVLYHWQINSTSTSSNLNNKTNIPNVSKKLLRSHLERTDTIGVIEDGLFYGSYRIKNIDTNRPKVSILIPNNNQLDLLKKCINSILTKTAYNNYEILILENNSTDIKLFNYYNELSNIDNIKIIEWNNKFNFSAINNYGASLAMGEYLLFLNNDIEIISESWLDDMIVCMRDGVGIVGAKLYYPDDSIQHAGVILNQNSMPSHVDCKRHRNDLGYMGRLKIVQNLTSVTGACLLTSKKIFNEVGGLTEDLALAFNDIDYCYKVYDKGYRIVWTPYAELYHYESKTRGYENTPEKIARFNKEFSYLKDTWDSLLRQGDKMYPKQILSIGGN